MVVVLSKGHLRCLLQLFCDTALISFLTLIQKVLNNVGAHKRGGDGSCPLCRTSEECRSSVQSTSDRHNQSTNQSSTIQTQTSNMTKLYCTFTSCGAASFIAARVAGVTIDVESVNIGTHVTASGVDYYSINPKGNVPCLVLDDGTMLNEGAAVLQYITDQVRIIPLRFLSRILNISLYLIPSFRANRLLALSPRSMARARDISPRT
jgi:hypothetical protein